MNDKGRIADFLAGVLRLLGFEEQGQAAKGGEGAESGAETNAAETAARMYETKENIIEKDVNTMEGTKTELTITIQNFDAEVMRSDKPVLVDFWAPWCGPCRMLGPVIEEIAGERSDIKVGKVNVDDESELAGRYAVHNIPTVILFRGGQPVARSVGYRDKSSLLRALGL
jgi:thioredoxin 1